jgi:hypothetical protein
MHVLHTTDSLYITPQYVQSHTHHACDEGLRGSRLPARVAPPPPAAQPRHNSIAAQPHNVAVVVHCDAVGDGDWLAGVAQAVSSWRLLEA